MGWLLAIEGYFSLSVIGFLVGLVYPFIKLFILNRNVQDQEIDALRKPLPLIMASFMCSARFGFYTILLLVILAFVGGIVFSLWAILTQYGT